MLLSLTAASPGTFMSQRPHFSDTRLMQCSIASGSERLETAQMSSVGTLWSFHSVEFCEPVKKNEVYVRSHDGYSRYIQ